MSRKLIGAVAALCVIIATGVAAYVLVLTPRMIATQMPARVLRIILVPNTRELFFDKIKSFADAHDFSLTKNLYPLTPNGPHYVFELSRTDLWIFCANRVMDTGPIDPNGHEGAPPPKFDPSDYDVLFYNQADLTGKHSSRSVDDLVRVFVAEAREIKGSKILVLK